MILLLRPSAYPSTTDLLADLDDECFRSEWSASAREFYIKHKIGQIRLSPIFPERLLHLGSPAADADTYVDLRRVRTSPADLLRAG